MSPKQTNTCVLSWSIWGLCLLLSGQTPGVAEGERSPAPLRGQSPFAKAVGIQLKAIREHFDSPSSRWTDYLRAKKKAYAWLNQLQVDSVELIAQGLNGKKKFAELLDAYAAAYRYAKDQVEQAHLRQRMLHLAQQTRRTAYHNMHTNSDAEFRRSIMSYLRVLWLLDYIGLDTTDYRHRVDAIKSRLNAIVPKFGPWRQEMVAKYYDAFGLQKPDALLKTPLRRGLIAHRPPISYYNRFRSYHLAHEIFVVFDFGYRQTRNAFSAVDRAYLRGILPTLIERSLNEHNADLLAELLSCMTYLGWQSSPEYHRGIAYLLDHQNPTGTWGNNYESRRERYGKYLDQQLYLHTTLVVVQALMEAYDGRWQPAE